MAASQETALGLFDDAPARSHGEKRKAEHVVPSERRIKLKTCDAAAAQLLNPYGCSLAKNMSVKEVWQAVAEASKVAVFHSELAATVMTGGPYRVGVGLSRVAESLLAAFAQLREPLRTKIIIPELLQAAMTDADTLTPSLQDLACRQRWAMRRFHGNWIQSCSRCARSQQGGPAVHGPTNT